MNTECPFCSDTESVINNHFAYARFDKYPVTEGHLLIIPYRHVADFFSITKVEREEILDLVDVAKELLDKRHHPDGYNIGINCGQAAGQTVMHMHIHLIPRYKNDMTNPEGGVRGVIPEKQKY